MHNNPASQTCNCSSTVASELELSRPFGIENDVFNLLLL